MITVGDPEYTKISFINSQYPFIEKHLAKIVKCFTYFTVEYKIVSGGEKIWIKQILKKN